MPTYEYRCDPCEIEFEETLLQTEDIKAYTDWHPCPSCHERAERLKISTVNFAFKGPKGQVQGSGVHGQSGVHDLDYPKLDKAVGRSADKKWGVYTKRKEVRDKVRRETGTNAVTQIGDKIVPLDSGTGTLREGGIRTFRKVRKLHGQ